MRVALVHNALIPPPRYGGTERAIYWLAKGLRELGHEATLVAKPGSHAPGASVLGYEPDWEARLPANIDVLHLWATPGRTPRKPFVVTIEGNGQPGETFHANTIFISRKHAENHTATHFVYNGIDPGDYECGASRGDYAVFLAKASWKVKNLEGATAVARAAGLRLEVLGSRDWPMGLHRWLPPIRGARYRGMVGDAEKRELLSRARALIFPVRWHEPFGIAVTEALASGCPILGTPYGSLPEIVSPEVGVLSADGGELARAAREIAHEPNRFAPARCRERVQRGFTHLDMARAYVKHYESVLSSGGLAGSGPEAPGTRQDFDARELLPWSPP